MEKKTKTYWRTFKYFLILSVSTYYILCISWIIKCLIIIDAGCKREDLCPVLQGIAFMSHVQLLTNNNLFLLYSFYTVCKMCKNIY